MNSSGASLPPAQGVPWSLRCSSAQVCSSAPGGHLTSPRHFYLGTSDSKQCLSRCSSVFWVLLRCILVCEEFSSPSTPVALKRGVFQVGFPYVLRELLFSRAHSRTPARAFTLTDSLARAPEPHVRTRAPSSVRTYVPITKKGAQKMPKFCTKVARNHLFVFSLKVFSQPLFC